MKRQSLTSKVYSLVKRYASNEVLDPIPMCGWEVSPRHHQAILWTTAECPIIQLNSDPICPEMSGLLPVLLNDWV